jgi:hypothetical protein
MKGQFYFPFVSWIPLPHFIRKGMTEELTLPLLRLCRTRGPAHARAIHQSSNGPRQGAPGH